MSRFHARMEDGVTVTAATYQDPKFSLDAGRFKDGVVWVKVKNNGTAGQPTFEVVSATEKDAPDAAWTKVGNITLGATGKAKPCTFSSHARYIRWYISGMGSSSTVTFAADSYMNEE